MANDDVLHVDLKKLRTNIATLLNEKIDIPWVPEMVEAQAFQQGVDAAVDAMIHALSEVTDIVTTHEAGE